MALLTSPVEAADWLGTVSSDWFDPDNWSGGVPGDTTRTKIDTIEPHATTIRDTAVSEEGQIGSLYGIQGAVTASGVFSLWFAPTLYVGLGGNGTLNVLDNGSVYSTKGYIGYETNSQGVANLIGAGSAWITTDLVVGYDGSGTLNVLDHSLVLSTKGYIGYETNSQGVANVIGAASEWITTDLVVGYVGSGALHIGAGGVVRDVFGYVALGGLSAGSVTITGAGSTWFNEKFLAVGVGGAGAVTIAESGTLRVGDGTGPIYVGGGWGSGSGSLSIGANLGSPAVGPGFVEAGVIYFGSGLDSLVFNHTSANYSFNPVMDGRAAISVLAGNTVLTADSSGFSGTTSVTGGSLLVNGALGGTVSVSNGGLLGGAGVVGGTTIESGGVIAPGNSIGTLTVNGDLAFKSGSFYKVEVDPTGTASDLIIVNGVALLGGSVVPLGADYKPQSKYRILTAAGGFGGTTFGGTFGGISSSYLFLSPQLTYDLNNVFLSLDRNAVPLASVAATPNEAATAGAADGLTFGNPAYDAIVKLKAPEARRAFDQLSGELHASAHTALIGDSDQVRRIVSQHFQSNRRAATGMPLAYAPLSGPVRPVEGGAYTAWGQAFGSWGRTGGDGNATALKRNDGGFLVGADAVLTQDWSLGGFAGHSQSSFNARDRASSGSSDNFHLGVYGGTEVGPIRLNAGAAQTWHNIAISRTVGFMGFSDRLSASYGGSTTQIFGEAGYKISLAALRLEPFAGLAYVDTRTKSFVEAGGPAALTGGPSTTPATYSTLGLRASSQFSVMGVQATAKGMVGWRHAFGDVAPITRLSFSGGSPFVIAGTPIATDAAIVEATLDLAVGPTATLGISYNGQYGNRARENGANARLQVTF